MTNCKCGCEVWCEHWTIRNGEYYSPEIFIGKDWKFCPICGTPRPECKKKSLAKILREKTPIMSTACSKDCFDWDETAKAAVEHFCELVDEWCKANSILDVNILKRTFREES